MYYIIKIITAMNVRWFRFVRVLKIIVVLNLVIIRKIRVASGPKAHRFKVHHRNHRIQVEYYFLYFKLRKHSSLTEIADSIVNPFDIVIVSLIG